MSKIRSAPDSLIIVSTLLLLGIGLIMVYSASAVLAFHNFGDSLFYLKRQFIFAVLGIIALFATMNIDYWTWKKFAKLILTSGFIMLILVLIIGDVRGGAKSWLGVGSLGIQPSEFMKLAIVLFLAKFLAERQTEITSFVKGLMPPLLLVGTSFAMIMLQPDLGTGAVLVGASIVVIYVAGAKISHLVSLAMIGVVGLVGLIITAPYRLKRITGFLNPWEDPLGSGYQIIQSLYAIGPGGLVGLGLGRSRQKYNYLPEPQTDFIFSIISEELGFIGGSVVLLLFLILIWRGLRVAITAPDSFGSLLAVGIIGIIGVQVMINIGVVIGMFPVTGITLPLISAGGSSLTLLLTAIGILLNISRYSR
ncbi:stage V sporulation protein E [Chengkuizengella marina]|uniref:Stage V sporulation protein E n=1 Tax=Chengkuizengella marina TaxID=2507566 RepID=A0A6N9Q3P4_9BACL|nr:stage V sporulation protein E [Chengkuizengella marina]NBI29422.1 stage V sporulation protein E [Chengkuizengella marina]